MDRNERIIDTRLGRQAVALDKIIHFPRGLMGYEDQHEFTLLQIKPEAPFLVLQSLREPRLGLLVADPYCFMDEYQIRVNEAEQKLLNISSREQVAILVTVSIPPGRPEKTALNLSGPILINQEDKLGLQVPQVEGLYPPQLFIHQPGCGRDEPGKTGE